MKRVKQRLAGVNRAVLARLKAVVLLIALANLMVSSIIAYRVYDQSVSLANDSFQDRSQIAVNSIANRLTDYQDLLYSGQALLNNTSGVTQQQWDTFYRNQGIYQRYKGVNSVAFIASVTSDQYNDYVSKMRSNDYVGSIYAPPAKTADTMGLLNVYSSNDNISQAYKKNFYTDAIRMPVYKSSGTLRRPVASPPTTLVTGYEGFFISLPLSGTGAYSGYIVVAFRYDELMQSLLPKDPSVRLSYSVSDVAKQDGGPIYQSENYKESDSNVRQFMDVGDRTWLVKVADVNQSSNAQTAMKLPLVIVASAIIILSTISVLVRFI